MVTSRVVNPTNSVTRQHRTAFVLLLDLSCSMMEIITYNSFLRSKSEALSDICNKILQELYMLSFRDNEVLDYYDIAVIGYSGDKVVSLMNNDTDDPFVSIKSLADCCKGHRWASFFSVSQAHSPESLDRMDDSTIIITACGSTPMYEALRTLYRAINMWCSRYENFDSPAPMIFHISDGHPTDSDLNSIIDISNRIKSIKTNCGETLLLNIKFDTEISTAKQLLFPTDEEIADYPCAFTRTMARASSLMPESFTPLINEIRGHRYAGEFRGFGCNISVADIISMLNIGTLSVVAK